MDELSRFCWALTRSRALSLRGLDPEPAMIYGHVFLPLPLCPPHPPSCDFKVPMELGSRETSPSREEHNAHWSGLGSWRERPWSVTSTQASGWEGVGPRCTSREPGSEVPDKKWVFPGGSEGLAVSDPVWELLAPRSWNCTNGFADWHVPLN